LQERGVSADLLTPFATSKESVATMRKMAGQQLGAILPYIIILMCFLGAMYPAIDLAAGEKERGTLETLLVSPASRGEFVIGKYLVILFTGTVAALLALTSMTFSMNYMVEDQFGQMARSLAIEFDVSTVALILLILLPMAGLFAAILLSVSVFARSFKEAQSYITALNMLVILPAFVSLIPGIKTSLGLALIPVANVSLIIKDAISGTVAWDHVAVALASSLLLATGAILFAKSWFERESVLFRT
jgi:sodium transport system permease protein